jgi:RNA polymerase sigma-70 factor, ECF subfamily
LACVDRALDGAVRATDGSLAATGQISFVVRSLDDWGMTPTGPVQWRPTPSDGPHYTFWPAVAPFSVVEQDASVKSAGPEGLEQVYREHAAQLWRALVAYTGDREISDDALAEAFAQAVGRGDALRTPERWVWIAAFRIAAGELKTRAQRTPVHEMAAPAEGSEAVELLEALAKLSPKQRAVLVLHYYGGYKSREIALILGSTAATVRVHLSAGRKRLRALLEVDDG